MALLGGVECLLVLGAMLVTTVTSNEVYDRGDPEVRLFYRDPWPSEPITESTAVAMETAGGGACPTSMCENGGSCVLAAGKYQCVCADGFIGHKCQDMRLELSCDPHGMGLRVLKAVISHFSPNISSFLTSNGKCAAQETELHIAITLSPDNHTQCGTRVKVNGTHLIYSNELLSGAWPQEGPRNSISRSADLRIAFSCVYHYDRVVSLPFPLITSASLVTFVVKEGEFLVQMTLHPSADFLDPYDRPPIIPLTNRLYVQLQILRHDPRDLFTLGLEECWATPGQNPTNNVRHLIISRGLASDVTVAILDSGNRSLNRFSLQMFHFVKFPEFFLHCRVWLFQGDAGSCCPPTKSSSGRYIRDLSDPYRKVVSCGPIRVSTSSVSGIGKPQSGISPFLLPASSAAALALLLLGLVSIAKVLRKQGKLRAPPLLGLSPPPICVTTPPSCPSLPPTCPSLPVLSITPPPIHVTPPPLCTHPPTL